MMNPFRPTAGATPPELIGREGTLDEFEYGLQIGSGAPGLLTIITGARGIGKTALLGAAQDKAVQQGWVVAETATSGFIGRIGETMRLHLEELGKGPAQRRITALGVAGFTVTTQLPPEQGSGTPGLLTIITGSRGIGKTVMLNEAEGIARE
ncbi:ATP-binding protein [Paenarthrobacter sp. AT5]|uniref:ATP-binding protein n=1 Tax=Paenarthrobacter TaxID=1742992 RepID=UPI001BB71746|nr:MULTISPECIES: ATP-binding protein [Paenarthrobacter]QSZ51884.1 hypothetical protein AYX19_01920 [Paenarthrobacter ureafaciens]WOC61399.1 ATP-binding protein [Paenarthrobacter sp. AT5]